MPLIGRGGPGKRATPSQEAATTEAERAEALSKLKDLLDSGVLSEQQYEAEKQKILQRR